jgi:hypothetical protein
MEWKANSLGDHRSYLSGHFLRFLIISSHSIKFWLYISLSSLFMTNTMLLRVNSIFCHSPIFLEEILHYGSQSGMCSSSLSILYHIVIKSGHIDISSFTALLGIVYLFILDSVSLPPTFSIEFVLVILLVMILNLETELRNLSLYNVLKYCFWTTLHLFELIWEQKGSKC